MDVDNWYDFKMSYPNSTLTTDIVFSTFNYVRVHLCVTKQSRQGKGLSFSNNVT